MAWFASLAVTALLLAQPPSEPNSGRIPVALTWTAPQACPNRDAVATQIQRLAPSAELVESEPAALSVEAIVSETADGFGAEVTLHTNAESRNRTLVADDCVLLAQAVGLVAAVALDPVVVASQLEPASPPAEIPEPEPVPEPEPEPEPAPDLTGDEPDEPPSRGGPRFVSGDRPDPPRKRPPLDYGARFGLGVGGLVLPGAGPGFVVAPWLGVDSFVAQLSVQYWTPRPHELDGVDAGALFQLVTFGARACPVLGTGRWRFPLCIGVDLGPMIAAGRGQQIVNPQTPVDLWAAAIVQPGFEVALTPRFGLWAAFEAAISLRRPTFHVVQDGTEQELHQPEVFGPRGFVGVTVHTPRL